MKKGDVVAFSVTDIRYHPADLMLSPAHVTRATSWHIGRVRAGTRDGKVREVEDGAGRRWKMCAKGYGVEQILPILPTDLANVTDLIDSAGGIDFATVEDARAHALAYATDEVRTRFGLESAQ